jgi:hypothetical protein
MIKKECKDKDGWFSLRENYLQLREHPEWLNKYPTGPVHWDIKDSSGKIIEDVSAKELRDVLARNYNVHV